jgi:ATP-binding cassette subfamily B protein
MIQASNGKTLLVITHRFITTQNLDKIVVLSEGRLVEMGSHEELLQKKGEYASMYESQAKAFREKRQEELEEVFEDMIEEHV